MRWKSRFRFIIGLLLGAVTFGNSSAWAVIPVSGGIVPNIHEACRAGTGPTLPTGENDDSYWIRELETSYADYYGSPTYLDKRYMLVDGDQSIRLFKDLTALNNCELFDGVWSSSGATMGCGPKVVRNLLSFYGKDLELDQVDNWLTTLQFGDDVATPTIPMRDDLQIYIETMFWDNGYPWTVEAHESDASIADIVRILSHGDPVIVLDYPDHWILIDGVVYNPMADEVEFHYVDNYDDGWHSASKLRNMMEGVNAPIPFPGLDIDPNTIVYINRFGGEKDNFIEAYDMDDFGYCINLFSWEGNNCSEPNSRELAWMFYDDGHCRMYVEPPYPYELCEDHGDSYLYNYDGAPEQFLTYTDYDSFDHDIRVKSFGEDFTTSFICEWIHRRKNGPDIELGRQPCPFAADSSIKSWAINQVAVDEEMIFRVHPTDNLVSRRISNPSASDIESVESYSEDGRYSVTFVKVGGGEPLPEFLTADLPPDTCGDNCPWEGMAGLVQKCDPGGGGCTTLGMGTVYDDVTLVTSAVIVQPGAEYQYRVVPIGTQIVIPVDQMVVHPEFSMTTLRNNVGILKLGGTIPDALPPMFTNQYEPHFIGRSVTSSGTYYVDVFSHADCASYWGNYYDSYQHICYREQSHYPIYQGGAPLFVFDYGEWMFHGFTSFSYIDNGYFPTVGTTAGSMRDWVSSTI